MKQIATILTMTIAVTVARAEDLRPDFGITNTFSICAVDPETGECGAAVASMYPAVGKVVPYVRADVGVFCTQHWHNPNFGEPALELLEKGALPEEVLAILLKHDERRDQRQLAIIDMKGRAANRNPAQAGPARTCVKSMTSRPSNGWVSDICPSRFAL